jgi:TPR repeat protein
MPTLEDALRAFESNDHAAARAACATAAKAGDPRAMQLLGRWHVAGAAGCAPDPGLAAYWFFQAWQAGLDDAEQDIIRVRAALQAAAESGSASAQTALGLIVMFGHDDPAAAMEWFELAAAQDHAEALRMLGYLFDEGAGVPRDDARAARFYERAAGLGDAIAQFQFARMLDEGRGVPRRDPETAIGWLRRAREQGMADAEGPLAELLAEQSRRSG